MRSLRGASFAVVLAAVAFVGVGCRDELRVQSHELREGPTKGSLVEASWNTPRSFPYEGMSGSTLDTSTPTNVPSAIGGGPPVDASNPPTGANDEGSPNMSPVDEQPMMSQPLTSKPDATDQSAGTQSPAVSH